MLDEEVEVVVHLPEGAFGAADEETVAGLLRSITERMFQLGHGYDSIGGLGGEFGYGVNYEDDLFMIHRYCWCEQDECPWCAGEAPNFLHKPSGLKIHWYKWIGRSMEIESPPSVRAEVVLAKVLKELLERKPA